MAMIRTQIVGGFPTDGPIDLDIVSTPGSLIVVAIHQYDSPIIITGVTSKTSGDVVVDTLTSCSADGANSGGGGTTSQIYAIAAGAGGASKIVIAGPTVADSVDATIAEYTPNTGKIFQLTDAAGSTNLLNGPTVICPEVEATGINNLLIAVCTSDSGSNDGTVPNGGHTFTWYSFDGEFYGDLLDQAAGAYVAEPTFTPDAGHPSASSVAFEEISSSAVYSVPDCRDYAIFPNDSRNVQDTLTYDVPAHPSHADPVDSRTAGAPVDCRKTAQIPVNCRTNPPF